MKRKRGKVQEVPAEKNRLQEIQIKKISKWQ